MMESTNSTLTFKRDPLHQQHHLKEAVSIAVKEECDLFIVSKDKKVFPCQRSLLVLYSPLISRILSDLPCCSGESPTIFLPFQEQHIKKFLHLLGSGQTILDENINSYIRIIANIAKVLQISMVDIKIGSFLHNPLGVSSQIKKELNNLSVKEEIKEEVEKLNVKQETKRWSEKDDEPEYIEEDESEKNSSDNIKKEDVLTAHSKVSLVMGTNRGSSTTEEDMIEIKYEAPNLEEIGTVSENREETEELCVQNPVELRDTSNDGDVEEQEIQSNQNCDGLGFITSVTSLSYPQKSVSSSVREGSLATPTRHSELGDLHVNDTVKRKKRGAGTPIGFYFEGENNEAHQLYEEGKKFIKSAGSASKDEAGLKDHMKIHKKKKKKIHNGDKRHVCSYCQKGFKKPSLLKIHIRFHTGEKPFQCEFCSKGFTQNSHLKEHTRTHTGEKPFQCEFCPKKFTCSGRLKDHTRIHTGEKPFQCEFCSKTFTKLSNLNQHTKIHTGEKPKTRKSEDLEEEITVSRKKRVKVGEAGSDKKKKDKKKEEEAEVKEKEMDTSIEAEGDATTSKKKAKEESDAAETTMDTTDD